MKQDGLWAFKTGPERAAIWVCFASLAEGSAVTLCDGESRQSASPASASEDFMDVKLKSWPAVEESKHTAGG